MKENKPTTPLQAGMTGQKDILVLAECGLAEVRCYAPINGGWKRLTHFDHARCVAALEFRRDRVLPWRVNGAEVEFRSKRKLWEFEDVERFLDGAAVSVETGGFLYLWHPTPKWFEVEFIDSREVAA